MCVVVLAQDAMHRVPDHDLDVGDDRKQHSGQFSVPLVDREGSFSVVCRGCEIGRRPLRRDLTLKVVEREHVWVVFSRNERPPGRCDRAARRDRVVSEGPGPVAIFG